MYLLFFISMEVFMFTVPRLNFAHLPTPIEDMPQLSAALGGPRLLVKRDDQTGLAFGGNKTRKLEFLLAEAQMLGARTIITAGAAQSNHCRQTAAAAAKFGFDCILVLSGDQPAQPSANLLLDTLFGAQIVWTDRLHRDVVLQQVYETAQAENRLPYLAPYGGSSPTGALGYAFAVEEFLGQNVQADWILFASSSGGTQAGLVLGQRIFGYKGMVLGISIDEPELSLKEHVARIASGASEKLGPRIEFESAGVLVNDSYCAAGYGVLTDTEREAIHLFARTEGLLIDPVYTGRAAGGLIDLVRKGFFKKDETVLFWHTGGSTALFAENYQSRL
jgi:D-cysteine desulfhydrase family pyridoxal phosphate-dependent enzyme